jgi:type I restriction enzyme S subunit
VPFKSIVAHSAFGPRFAGELYSDDGNVATLRTTDLSSHGEISYSTMPLARIDENKFESHFLKKGDLVISRSGRIGTAAIFEEFDLPVLPGAFLLRFRLCDDVEPKFYRYFFNSPVGRSLILSVAKGAAQQNINLTNVELLSIPRPSKREQKAIVSILSPYDDLIANNRRRIALLEEAARLLYREWFVCFRFPGHEHVKIVAGNPEGWERLTLGAVAETNHDSYSAKELPDEINYIDISSVTRGRITSKTLMTAAEAPGRARRKARDGDIIWSNVRPNLRAHALILEPEANDVFSTGFTVLTPKKIPFTWLYQFVTADRFVGHLVNHATGAGYPAVRPDDFERATVVVPPKALLTYFHETTEPSFRLIAKLNIQNAKLAQARDLLLPRLMSGEITA